MSHRHCEHCGEVLPHCACEQEEWEDDGYSQEDYEDELFERELERAERCTCGAYQIINGKPVTIADCCCGA